MIKDKIQSLLEQMPPNGKQALMSLAEELDKTIEGLKTKKDELTSKISELNTTLETSVNDLKAHQF